MSASSKKRRQRRASEAAARKRAGAASAKPAPTSAHRASAQTGTSPQRPVDRPAVAPVAETTPSPTPATPAPRETSAPAVARTALLERSALTARHGADTETPTPADDAAATRTTSTDPSGTPRSRGRRRGAGLAAALTLVIAAGYVVVSGSFTFPDSPANAAVNDGFAPYFAQRWDVFAPSMQKVNTGLSIQVQWRDGTGELVRSDWVDVTGMELTAAAGPFPSRIVKDTANAVSTYLTRFDDLTDAQKDRVTDTFIERAPEGGFQPIPDDELVADVQSLGNDHASDATIPFIRYDYMLTRFAAAFGQAYFGEQIERVRWRIDYQRPNDFDHRNDQQQQFSPSETVFGWRQPAEDPDPETVAVFSDVIERYSR